MRITGNGRSVSLAAREREGADGTEVFVRAGTLGMAADETLCVSVRAISATTFRASRLVESASGRLDLAGLLCVATGMSIPLAFNLGKILPLIPVDVETGDMILWSSSVLSLIGVTILGIRRIWFLDD